MVLACFEMLTASLIVLLSSLALLLVAKPSLPFPLNVLTPGALTALFLPARPPPFPFTVASTLAPSQNTLEYLALLQVEQKYSQLAAVRYAAAQAVASEHVCRVDLHCDTGPEVLPHQMHRERGGGRRDRERQRETERQGDECFRLTLLSNAVYPLDIIRSTTLLCSPPQPIRQRPRRNRCG